MSQDNKSEKKVATHRQAPSRERYSKEDIAFMNSLSAAVLAGNPARSNFLLYIITLVVAVFLCWAGFAKLDERTRGLGRVIPSRQIQVVQNLEGGIIKEIRVGEGDAVTKGQVLVTIDDTGAGSTFAESKSKINELKARAVRLRAEAGIQPFEHDSTEFKDLTELIEKEKRLYDANIRMKKSAIAVLNQRLNQRKIELSEARLNIDMLKKSTKMIAREMALMKPLYKKQLVSELELIQLKQKALDKNHQLQSAKKSLETLKSKIIEAENQIAELEDRHRAEAQEEYNKVMAEVERLDKTQLAIADRVARTNVRSPVDGTVKQLLINTVGGVVRPGMDILEIVPNEKNLLVEAKIKPSDIAFLHPGLKAVAKLTAYDFAIYGGLEGRVKHISADTITDERKEEFYLVRIETDQNYLGSEENMKDILVGMTAQVDIITGSKTIMQYLMKPILRAKENALRER
ncbi:MAG: HlyD family type I secretion periplasmic adaptor subunit [Desulfobacteraceae bacterium]|nr:HlyD family type I secretion periplasmic adaptor subunit [Desulfobacteraceae bacterium]